MVVGKLRIKFKRTKGIDWIMRNKLTIAFLTLGAVLGILALGIVIDHKILGAFIGVFSAIIVLMLSKKEDIDYFDNFFAKNKIIAFAVLIGSLILAFNYILISQELLGVIKERFFAQAEDSITLIYLAVGLYASTLAVIFCFLYLGFRWGLKIFDKHKKHNNYIIWSMILILFTLIIGLSFIQDTYSSKFPFAIRFEDNEVFSSDSLAYCNSHNGYDVFVVGDTIDCQFNLKIRNATKSSRISAMTYNMEYNVYPGWDYISQKEKYRINTKPEFRFDSSFLLKGEGMSDVVFNFALINDTDPRENTRTISTERYAFESVTLNTYRDRTKDFITNLLIVISIAVFSILSAMQNLKELLERQSR